MAAVIGTSVVAGLLIAGSSLRDRTRKHAAPVTGVCFGIGTGLLYGVGSLAIKALSGILTGHHTAADIVTGLVSSPYLYTLTGSLAVAMLLFQVALQTCRASIVVPVSGMAGSVYFVIAGTWLFHEHLPASPGKLALRLAGIVLAALVLVLLSRQAPGQSPSQAVDGAVPGDLADVRRR
jgi:multidrug transporter EmrE-like cation transporter